MQPHALLVVTAAVLATGLTACGQDAASSGNGVAITATDSTCEVASTSVGAGKVVFNVTNKGSKVTEVYVYGKQDGAFTKVISEVENIGPGATRDLTVDLTGGEYEVACKPGQTGDGIRTKINVSGGAAASTSASAAARYDREIEIEVTATGIEGADGLTAKTGEKIEFKLENEATGKRALEIVDPGGKVVAEVEADANGRSETIVELATAGTWTLKIEGDGIADVEKTLVVAG